MCWKVIMEYLCNGAKDSLLMADSTRVIALHLSKKKNAAIVVLYFVVWWYINRVKLSAASEVVWTGSRIKYDTIPKIGLFFSVKLLIISSCASFCSGVPCVFCKCVTAVHQQASGHVSYQWREEGKLTKVKYPLSSLLKWRLCVVCSSWMCYTEVV